MGKPKKTTKDEIKISEDDLKNNPKVILEYMKKDKTIFKNVSENVKKDVEFLLTVVQQYKSKFIFQYIPEELKKDKEFILKCLDFDKTAYLYCSEEVKKDFEVALKVVKEDKFFIQNIPEEFKKNKEFISKISQLYGINFSLQFSGEVLEEDKETLIREIKEGKLKMSKLPENLKKDKEIISIILSKDGLELENLTEEFKKDPSLIEIAISQNPKAIEFISQDLLSNKDFILKILSGNNVSFYDKLSKDLQQDPDIIIGFLKMDSNIFQKLSNEMKKNRPLLQKIVEAKLKLKSILPYMDKSLKSDRDLMVNLINIDPISFEFCSKELKKDKEILLRALQHFGVNYILNTVDSSYVFNIIKGELTFFKKVTEDLLQYPNRLVEFCEMNDLEFVKKNLSEIVLEDKNAVLLLLEKLNIYPILTSKLKNNHEVIEKACITFGFENISSHIDEKLLKDEEFIKKMIKKGNIGIYERIDSKLKNDVYFINELLDINPNIFELLSESIRSKDEIIIRVLKSNPSLFKFIPQHLQNDVIFVFKLIKQHKLDILNYLPDTLKNDSTYLLEGFYNGIVKFKDLPEEVRKNKQNIMRFLQCGLMDNKDVDTEFRKDLYISTVMILRNTPSFKIIETAMENYLPDEIIKTASYFLYEILTSSSIELVEVELLEILFKNDKGTHEKDLLSGLRQWAISKSKISNKPISELVSNLKGLIEYNQSSAEDLYDLKHGSYDEYIDDDNYLNALEYKLIHKSISSNKNDLLNSVILKKNALLISQLTDLYKFDSWSFLYRKQHNFNDFYQKCSTGMSVTLIETKKGCIFGFYNPVGYHPYEYQKSYNSMKTISLFTLINNFKIPPTKFKLMDSNGFKNEGGLTFGAGEDVHISFSGKSFSKFGKSFTSNILGYTEPNLLISPDQITFEIENMEVFSVNGLRGEEKEDQEAIDRCYEEESEFGGLFF